MIELTQEEKKKHATFLNEKRAAAHALKMKKIENFEKIRLIIKSESEAKVKLAMIQNLFE